MFTIINSRYIKGDLKTLNAIKQHWDDHQISGTDDWSSLYEKIKNSTTDTSKTADSTLLAPIDPEKTSLADKEILIESWKRQLWYLWNIEDPCVRMMFVTPEVYKQNREYAEEFQKVLDKIERYEDETKRQLERIKS